MKGSASALTGKFTTALATVAFALILVFGLSGQAQAAQGDESLVAGSAAVSAQEDDEMDGDVDEPEDVGAGLEDEEDATPQLGTASFWAGDNDGDYVGNYVSYNDDVTGVLSVKSSNPKALKIIKDGTSTDLWSYKIKPLKAGKATVTITYKDGGQTRVLKNTFTVKTFSKPITSITVNGKKLPVPTAKNFTQYLELYNFKGSSVKVKITTAKGWTIESMYAERYTRGAMEPDNSFEIKNGQSFKLGKKKDAGVGFTLARENGDGTTDTFSYGIGVNRGNPIELKSHREDLNTVYVGYSLTGKLNSFALFLSCDTSAKISKVTSSNPKILAAKCGKSPASLKLTGKKPGKSTVTLEYKYKGKKYTTKAEFVVSESPVSSLAINGKKAKLKNARSYNVNNYKKGSIKLNLTPNKGWTVKAIQYYSSVSEKTKKAKNGSKIAVVKNDYLNWVATLKNKSGKTFFFYVDIERR